MYEFPDLEQNFPKMGIEGSCGELSFSRKTGRKITVFGLP
jgi:hypothetical protein